jgi:hypothetical protein
MKLSSCGPAAALLAALAGPCVAETTPYYVGGVVSYGYNSNVLGLVDGQPLPTGLGYTSKSDHIASFALVGGLDQQISRQRVFGDVTLRRNKYTNNSLLDNDSYAITAGADLQTVERISGNVLLKSSRDQIAYGIFERPTGEQVLVTANSADFSVRVGGPTRVSFEAGFGYRSLDYSTAAYDTRDYRQTSVSLGGRYAPSDNSSFGLGVRAANGVYPHFDVATGIEESFHRTDIDLSGSWKVSGVTSVSGRASYTNVDYKIQDILDFTGWTGALKASWQPTVRWDLSAELARDRGQDLRFGLDQFGTRVDSPQLVSALWLRAAYEVTAKVGVTATVGYSSRPVSVINPFFGFADTGTEKVRQFAFGAGWAATRTSRIGCDYSVERRRSDVVAQLNTSVDAITCSAQLTLQP